MALQRYIEEVGFCAYLPEGLGHLRTVVADESQLSRWRWVRGLTSSKVISFPARLDAALSVFKTPESTILSSFSAVRPSTASASGLDSFVGGSGLEALQPDWTMPLRA